MEITEFIIRKQRLEAALYHVIQQEVFEFYQDTGFSPDKILVSLIKVDDMRRHIQKLGQYMVDDVKCNVNIFQEETYQPTQSIEMRIPDEYITGA